MERLRHCLVILILAAAIPGCAGYILDDPGTSGLDVTTVELRLVFPGGETVPLSVVEGGSGYITIDGEEVRLDVLKVRR